MGGMFGEPMRNHLDKDFQPVKKFSKDWFFALWKGERPLWEAWLLLGLVVWGTMTIANVLVFSLFRPEVTPLLSLVLWAFGAVLQVYWWVSAWRCSTNVHNNLYFYISRTLIAVGALATIADFLRN